MNAAEFSKCLYLSTKVHSIAMQETVILILLLIYFIQLHATLVDVSSSLYYKYLNTLHVLVQLAIIGHALWFVDLFK
jgi:hypothetical protein